MSIIAYLAQLSKPLTAFFVGLLGGLLVRKNQELKQETKNQQKLIAIQEKIIDAKKNDKVANGRDVIKRMLENKYQSK